MTDWEIQLDAEGGPGTARADPGLPQIAARIEHLPAGNLVQAAMEVASDVWKNGAAQVLIFESKCAELCAAGGGGERDALAVGVNKRPTAGLELIEVRVEVGVAFDVGEQSDCICRDLNLTLCSGEACQEATEEGGTK